MKTILSLIIALIASISETSAEQELLIPKKVNAVLAKVKPGMSEADILSHIRKTYPNSKIGGIRWSGASGVIEFVLDKRYSISLTAFSKNSPDNRLAHNDLVIYITNRKLKRKMNISFSRTPYSSS